MTDAFVKFYYGTALLVCASIMADMAVVEYVSDGRVTTTGNTYANVYIGVYWFRDGLICRVREFFNPMVAARALRAGSAPRGG